MAFTFKPIRTCAVTLAGVSIGVGCVAGLERILYRAPHMYMKQEGTVSSIYAQRLTWRHVPITNITHSGIDSLVRNRENAKEQFVSMRISEHV